ncbi:hypothetical protein N0V88_003104 [Collariella sp. IMI 366227]|nr:hypothetical protein N0V88_003104 [Collariella sp. IMI 366227]
MTPTQHAELEEKARLQVHLQLQEQALQSPLASPSRSPASGSNTVPMTEEELQSSPPAILGPPPTVTSIRPARNPRVPVGRASTIRQQATIPPKPQIHIVGKRGGRLDFSIKINLMHLLVPEDARQRMDYLRCVGPGEVAFRGGSKPAVTPELEGEGTVEAWAAKFVADNASVRSFVLERVVINLDVHWLEGQVRALLVGLKYPGTVAVSFPVTHSRVVVQSPDRVNKFITSVTGFFAGKKKYEVVKAVWPFATMPRGAEADGRRCAVQSEETWWKEWRDPIRYAIATKRNGWVTNEDKLEALMEGMPSSVPADVDWGPEVETAYIRPRPHPPFNLWPRLDRLRALYDKAYPKWPPHINLVYPFSEVVDCAAHKFLVEKVGLVPGVEWTVGELAVLVRERTGQGQSVMRLWGTVGLDGRVKQVDGLGSFYEGEKQVVLAAEKEGEDDEVAEKDQLHTGLPYYFEEEMQRWVSFTPSALDSEEDERSTFAVATYNILAEFEWPPSEARYPLVVKNILADNAAADALVLQEVTDGFLSYLLADEGIRDAYPYCSHGPPDQDDIEPLPSHLNVVVLSKIAFDWEYVSFHRKHKGAVVARFKDVGRSKGDKFFPVVLAAVHLSHGLTDGAVASKKADIKQIIGYLSGTYPQRPWILAGDFNVTTSSATIDAALRKKAISEATVGQLKGLNNQFAEANLDDAWKTSLADDPWDGDSNNALEGEEGATWDPTSNGVAAAMAGGGANMRPQRYDRILVRGEGLLEIAKFNMFGFLTEKVEGADSEMFASDHWGLRCIMNIDDFGDNAQGPSEEIASLVVPVHPQKAPEHLDQPGSVKEALLELGIIPSTEEGFKRKAALELLRNVILDTPTTDAGTRPQPTVIIIPVGSYALDVWTSSSDIDVLCIGPFSTNTFFALATQRLRKTAAQGIKILRRVRANTGTMLEIEVDSIKMDLQYCPATSVAERWPDVLRAPPSDPIWSLSAQTLSKLKAIRDIDYLRRSIPDLTAFRLAHRFIKTWAKSRGIYSARFGFLSGIQISILLARVHKLLTLETSPTTEPITVESLLTTFFTHYATFPWRTHLAFDPLFHRHRLPYTRTPREPLAILGYFPPALNTAAAASVPSTRTLAVEFQRASEALLGTNTRMSWREMLESKAAAEEFMGGAGGYKTYVKLDVQYWGLSLARGAQFLGWVESRCVMLLVDLHRRAPGLFVRMWPARFVEADIETGEGDEEQQEGERDFRGCYLIGLDKSDAEMGKEELKIALGALQTVLSRFETQMRGNEKYFDGRSCWLSAAVVNKGELGRLKVDRREWGEYTPGEEEHEEEEEEEQELGAVSGQGSDEDEAWYGSGKKDKKKKAAVKKQIVTVDLRADKTKKFRTAADVMNRIRWDPQLETSGYLVGYEDRFLGAQEKELEAWKSEQTDEEFIPQHRILYFKRKSDGQKVWDRRTKYDEVFGNVEA